MGAGMQGMGTGMQGMTGNYGMQGIGSQMQGMSAQMLEAMAGMGAMASGSVGAMAGYQANPYHHHQQQQQQQQQQNTGYHTTHIAQPSQSHAVTTTTSNHPNMRPGDWICMSCKAHNYK